MNAFAGPYVPSAMPYGRSMNAFASMGRQPMQQPPIWGSGQPSMMGQPPMTAQTQPPMMGERYAPTLPPSVADHYASTQQPPMYAPQHGFGGPLPPDSMQGAWRGTGGPQMPGQMPGWQGHAGYGYGRTENMFANRFRPLY